MKKQRRGIHLIAELANVSIGTVDRALHGRDGINESTRERILQIARKISYTPNLAARALHGRDGSTNLCASEFCRLRDKYPIRRTWLRALYRPPSLAFALASAYL